MRPLTRAVDIAWLRDPWSAISGWLATTGSGLEGRQKMPLECVQQRAKLGRRTAAAELS